MMRLNEKKEKTIGINVRSKRKMAHIIVGSSSVSLDCQIDCYTLVTGKGALKVKFSTRQLCQCYDTL